MIRYFKEIEQDDGTVTLEQVPNGPGSWDDRWHHVTLFEEQDASVSTVFLPLDHGWAMILAGYHDGTPICYETMIFGGPHDGFQIRHHTRAEALWMHEHVVSILRSGGDPNNEESYYTTMPSAAVLWDWYKGHPSVSKSKSVDSEQPFASVEIADD